MLPTFKEVVEELFVRGLVKAVFATETLALGINMPARSVVLEKLVSGTARPTPTSRPAEYTQLTGRAGRRGIDVEGHAVVLWQPRHGPGPVAGLAGDAHLPAALQLPAVVQHGDQPGRPVRPAPGAGAPRVSFAQFQADRSVVGIAKQVRSNEEALAGYSEAMTCHLGDFKEYARCAELRDRETELPRPASAQRRAEAAVALETLKPATSSMSRPGAARAAVVLQAATRGRKEEGAAPAGADHRSQLGGSRCVDFPAGRAARAPARSQVFNAQPASPAGPRVLAARQCRTSADPNGSRRRLAPGEDRDHRAAPAAPRAPLPRVPEREDHARWAERY